jgi:NAD+ synthase (glutamine-hydrolysing)
VDKAGRLIEDLPPFKEHIKTVDISKSGKSHRYLPQGKIESLHQALLLGIRDYFKKCGFSKAVLGLSGGIDSAVVCCLAQKALGSQNVLGISMPGPYSSKGSVEDSRKLAQNLGIKLEVVPISSVYTSYLDTLKEQFEGREFDVTEENIQARVRGNILVAFSNKFGYLVLSTGNKSELAVGYCTLYGDMSGGLAVISDVPKTMVYELAQYLNRDSEVIPKQIIQKPPSAELKPDQKDQDTLPPYEVLDQILDYYLDKGYSYQQIVKKGFNPDTVRRILRAVNLNEYKRRQAAPGLKVTTKAFGMGRRMPIAAKYEI